MVLSLLLTGFAGNLSAATTAYTYDAFGRLQDVLIEDSGRISFSYDDVGNRTRRTVTTSGRRFDANLSMSSSTSDAAVGRPTTLVMTIRNLGPDAAANVRAVLSFAGPFHTAELWTSKGRCDIAPVVCELGALGSGASARIEIRVVPQSANVISANGSSSAAEFDVDAANNATALSLSTTAGPSGDADADGVPDAWETRYGLDPTLAADAGIDSDRDGLSNLEEYVAGTNPMRVNLDTDERAALAELRARMRGVMPTIQLFILDDDVE